MEVNMSSTAVTQRTIPDYNDPPNTDEQPFVCPISSTLILNPIKLSCNHTFDRLPIAKWLRQSQNRNNIQCPLCKRNVTSVVENKELKAKIEKWVKDNKFSTLYTKDIKDQKEEYEDLVNKDVIPKQDEIEREADEPFPMHLDEAFPPLGDFQQELHIPHFLLGLPAEHNLIDPLQEIRDLIDEDDLEGAKNRAMLLNFNQNNEALRLITNAYIELNDLNKAFEIAASINDIFIKEPLYESIAKAHITEEDFDNAIVITFLLPSYKRNNIYYEISKKHVDNNEFIKAKETIGLIDLSYIRDLKYFSLAEYLLEKNNLKYSLEFANSITDYNSNKFKIYNLILDKYIESHGAKDIYKFSETMTYSFKKLKENNSYLSVIKKLFNLNLKSFSFFEKIKITFKFSCILSFSMIVDASKNTLSSIRRGSLFLYKKAFKI
jgi:hypothetical protein